jgi:hypothetical protein
MMVISEVDPRLAPATLSAEVRLSIDLAVAQWMRSPRATSVARDGLRRLGVMEAEIERRRRCQSADRSLAGILRTAVTLMIARGQLDQRDLRRLEPQPDTGLLRNIAGATAQAFYNVAIAESVERTPFAAIDLEIGDY